MTERLQPFTPEEEEGIASFAVEFARDPEMLEEASLFRANLINLAGRLLVAPYPRNAKNIELIRALNHEAGFIGEVIRRANSIRQFQGIDQLSELDRDTQEAGLGSIFDENSPIGQRLKKYL